MSAEVFTFVKYTFGDEKFIYTFDGATNGSLEMKIIMKVIDSHTKEKIYVVSGCHGKKNGDNWVSDGKKCGFQNRTFGESIL